METLKKIQGNGISSSKEVTSLKPIITARSSNGKEVKVDIEDLGLEEPVSPIGSILHEPDLDCTIVAMMGSSKKIDIELAKAGMEATMIRQPRFSSIQVLNSNGGAKWVRTTINIDDHIIIPQIDLLDIPSPELFIEDYVSNLSASKLDFTKPLWEVHILDIPTSEAVATAILRIHHSIGDGISLISLLVACTQSTSNPDVHPTLPGEGRDKVTNPTNKGWWEHVVEQLIVAWYTVVGIFLFVATALGLVNDTKTPIKKTKGAPKSFKKRFVNRTLSLVDMKIIKKATGATINDVLLGIVSAGLWRYLRRRYEKIDCTIPKSIRIRSAVMVNVRKSSKVQAFPNMTDSPNADSEWGNRIGFMLFPLPVMQLDCPLDYVKSAKSVADRKKSSKEAHFVYRSASFLQKTFGTKTAASMWCKVLSNTTLVLSNIPGPSEEIEFVGHPMSFLAPSIYDIPQALCIHCQSYMDKMKIVLAVDELVIPDPHLLCEDFVESLKEIKNATSNVGESLY